MCVAFDADKCFPHSVVRPHGKQSVSLWFSSHSPQNCTFDLWCVSASQGFFLLKPASCLCQLWLANKACRYNHPLWPLNLTACLLNASNMRLREASQFPPLSHSQSLSLFYLSSSPVLLACTALPSLHLPERLWPCLNPPNSQSTAVYPPGNTTDASAW